MSVADLFPRSCAPSPAVGAEPPRSWQCLAALAATMCRPRPDDRSGRTGSWARAGLMAPGPDHDPGGAALVRQADVVLGQGGGGRGGGGRVTVLGQLDALL